ncbi:hypothetical protein IJT93_00495 [bacterium]|nr:hypothetical protein [bacterium]
MKIIGISAAAILLLIIVAAARADGISRRLGGTWLETVHSENTPGGSLHFCGNKVRYENYNSGSGEAKYKITDKNKDGFTVTFDYTRRLERPSGEIEDREETAELLYHTENGRPILSEKGFEHGGRGPVIISEFLREDSFAEGFESELRKKLNSHEGLPTPSR